jgi:soluble lytic murein transglycosylase-like protein
MWKRLSVAALLAWDTAALAQPVPWGYAQVARSYGVPADVLYAVALTESGDQLTGGRFRPWPWTLNVQGRPERFRTRRDAYRALVRYLRQGITSIDVGLMQVNWHWHHRRLGTPWEALDPYHNMRVGSSILREEYGRSRDWRLAVGRYHSPANPRHAERYRVRVDRQLARIGSP